MKTNLALDRLKGHVDLFQGPYPFCRERSAQLIK